MIELKVIRIGSSLGVEFSADVVNQLNLADGDSVYLEESPDGFRLIRGSSELKSQLSAAREIASKRREALRELAK